MSVYVKENPAFLEEAVKYLTSNAQTEVVIVEDGPLTPEQSSFGSGSTVKYSNQTLPACSNRGLGLALVGVLVPI